ncbi:YitT family protein [Nitratidesulfovibrio sp. D1]|uniref:YitT family protein n=1 Tax=Nitratidesulfovibrio sp. D1 TaxID=3440151 RepID=UPI003EB948EF
MFTRKELAYSVRWNLLLLTVGSALFALGAQGIVARHGFLTGGIYGIALLSWYHTHLLSPAAWYLLCNIPLFVLGWLHVGRRFLLYSLYGMLATTLFAEVFKAVDLGVHDQLYAAVASGVICGAGSGIMLRSLGSGGGLDVAAIILHQRFGLGIGRFGFCFNVVLFAASLAAMPVDTVIASLIQVFIAAVTLEYVLALFNQRKVVFVISEHSRRIGHDLVTELGQGATFLQGRGGYSGDDREIVMTVTNNVQLKRMEELVFTVDPDALFIVENTFTVLGGQFARRKVY